MFRFLKKKQKKNKSNIDFIDINGEFLKEGDKVFSYRYELGECIIKRCDNGFEYESIENKKKVNWSLMVDAATERQKVKKIES